MKSSPTAMTIPDQPGGSEAAAASAREARLFASLDRSAFTKRHSWLYVVLNLVHLTDGFDILMVGVVLPGIIATFKLTASQAGFFASSVFLGMTVGAVTITYVADRVGRKKAMLYCVTSYAIFTLIASFAWSYESIVVLRLLQGVGLGAEVPLVLTYLLEFVPVRHRGVLAAGTISLWQFAGLLAALVAILVIPAFTWRGMFVVAAIPALIFIVAFAYLPESIRFLIHRDKVDEAEAIVRRFSSVDPDTVSNTSLVKDGTAETGLRDILRGRYLPRTLGVWIMSITWAMAFFGLVAWLPSILIRMGFTAVHSFAYTAAIVGAGAVGDFLCGWCMDYLGRRRTTSTCFFLGGISMIAWGFQTTSSGILLFGMLTAFFGTGGVAGCMFTYICELYPTQFRATGSGIATAWQRIGGIIAPSVLGVVIAANGSTFDSFLVLGIILLIGGVAAVSLMYETKGKTLEEIAAHLAG